MRRTFILLICVLLGCGSGGLPGPLDDDDSTPDPADAALLAAAAELYDADRVLEIVVDMDPDDADALAAETNSLFELIEGADCLDAPPTGPFNWYPGDITIDGELVQEVGLRKKGLLGSMSSSRPSFKVKFDKFDAQQRFHGLERLTLNNGLADPSRIKQCLGYQLFARAGLPAPRCNFAHVQVNEYDLGIYVNVEPVKKTFLKYAFDGDDEGDLYEGTLSDFRAGWTDTFEPETGASDPGRAPIHAVTEALAVADDADMLDALDEVLDLDAFHRFWATEVLIGHIDGYSGNRNNFYVYRPQGSDRLEFLPWGIDAIFRRGAAFGSDTTVAVMAGSALPRRLWEIPESRDDYLQALEGVIDEVWDEGWLLDEIDRMEELTEPFVLPDPNRVADLAAIRDFVTSREDELLAVLDEPMPTFDQPLGASPCLAYQGELQVEFEAPWDSIGSDDILNEGWSMQSGVVGGLPFELEGAAVSGLDGDHLVLAAVALTSPSSVRETVIYVPTWMFDGSAEIPLGGWGAQAYLLDIDFSDGQQQEILGTVWQTDLVFTELDAVPGGMVRASLDGPVYHQGG
jgi:spore coat protein CotH